MKKKRGFKLRSGKMSKPEFLAAVVLVVLLFGATAWAYKSSNTVTDSSQDTNEEVVTPVKNSSNTVSPKKVAKSPPRQSSNQTTQPTEPDNKSACNLDYQTLYENPVNKLGNPPTSAHIIRYIGTDEYEYQVELYNQKAKEYNNAVATYKATYLRLAHADGCDTSIHESLMYSDYARPYSG